MSEIPLHSLGRARKSRAGYIPLQNGELSSESEQGGEDMSMSSRAAAASSRRKGKRRERYDDSEHPEEHATLLGDDTAENEFRDEEAEAERIPLGPERSSKVRARASC